MSFAEEILKSDNDHEEKQEAPKRDTSHLGGLSFRWRDRS
jgi:hypothetical protein